MTIEGRPPFRTPPSPEEQARWQSEVEERRRLRHEAADRSAPVRRRLLEAGPPLRDVDAAMHCLDSCHPTVDVTDAHAGGTTCTCQLTEAERVEARRRAWEALATWRGTVRTDDQQAEADDLAGRLGVDVRQIGGFVPFQITAVVDGRSMYLRVRHESYELLLAPEDDPELFVTDGARWGVGELSIATGDEDELGPRWWDALAFCVQRVRDYLRQQECGHLVASESGRTRFRFCPLCGVGLPVGEDSGAPSAP